MVSMTNMTEARTLTHEIAELLKRATTEEKLQIKGTDRVANGRTKRQTAMAIDYAKEGHGNVH